MRLREATPVNELANRPDVLAPMSLGATYPNEPINYAPWVEDERNVTLMEDGFCAIFVWSAPFTYEVHIMARPDSRGGKAMRIGRMMLAYMKDIGAKVIWGRPSVYNRAAICYIRRMGLLPAGFGTHPVVGECQHFLGGL